MSSRWSLLLENMSISKNLSNDIIYPMFSSVAPSLNTPNRPESDLTKNSHRQPTPPKNDEKLRLSDFEIQTIHNEVDEDQNLDIDRPFHVGGSWR